MLKEIQELYNVKCDKYQRAGVAVSDELADVLLKEAMNEVIFADYINNGRNIKQ